MRITGLATGLDMDEIISSTMKAYRIKIDQKTQSKDVVEIRQTLYRDIMSDASKFYDKYFDITKSDSLLKPSNYKSVVFSSSSSSVTVTGNSDAKSGNYTVTGTPAKNAKISITENIENGKTITIDGKEFELKGKNGKEIAENLNGDLKKAGITVSATYTDFAGTTENKPGLVLESTTKDDEKASSFTVGGVGLVGDINEGKKATSAVVTGFTIDDVGSGIVSINGEKITGTTDDEIKKSIESVLTDFEVSYDEKGNITLTATTEGSSIEKPNIEIYDKEITFTKGEDEVKKTLSILTSQLGSGEQNVKLNGVNIKLDLSKVEQGKESEYLQSVLENAGIKNIEAKFENNQIIFSTSPDETLSLERGSDDGKTIISGEAANITIKNTSTGGTYSYSGYSNKVTLDGVNFTFNGIIDGDVKITGKNDVTEVKDKLVNFINDYNTLIEKLNTLTSTKHNRNYSPLTADQKKEMSETEIKLWNEKVEQGQLYKDSNLTRISSALKDSMRTFMEDSGLNLEKIGIVPVNDYSGTKNGTFIIDEDKLTKALEENTEEVMNLFTRPAPKELSEADKQDADKVKQYNEAKSQTGILYKLQSVLRSEFKSSTSVLAKKVGLQGTSTFSNNELTKSISDYESKIKDMEKEFTKREQALYSKYATLETMMNKLNSQQSSLQSMFGQ